MPRAAGRSPAPGYSSRAGSPPKPACQSRREATRPFGTPSLIPSSPRSARAAASPAVKALPVPIMSPGTAFAEAALAGGGIVIEPRLDGALEARIDDRPVHAEPDDDRGAAVERQEDRVRGHLPDEFPGRPLPGEAAADLEALPAQVVGAEEHDEPVAVALPELGEKPASGKRPAHLEDDEGVGALRSPAGHRPSSSRKPFPASSRTKSSGAAAGPLNGNGRGAVALRAGGSLEGLDPKDGGLIVLLAAPEREASKLDVFLDDLTGGYGRDVPGRRGEHVGPGGRS